MSSLITIGLSKEMLGRIAQGQEVKFAVKDGTDVVIYNEDESDDGIYVSLLEAKESDDRSD